MQNNGTLVEPLNTCSLQNIEDQLYELIRVQMAHSSCWLHLDSKFARRLHNDILLQTHQQGFNLHFESMFSAFLHFLFIYFETMVLSHVQTEI